MKIHDEMSQISVPEDLDEKTYQSILSAEKTVQKNRFRKKCAWSVLSCLVIIFGIIHVANPAMAENIPIIGSVFSYIQDVIDFKGDYKKYATNTDERVQDHGITISMTEAYCDGANLFVSYVIESQKKFTEYSDNQIFQNQIGYEGITKIKSDDKIYSLNDCGAAGVTGKYVDENTFAGSQYFDLSGKEFPDQYDVNEWNEGYSIDEVIVTPIITTIKTTHPDIYRDNFNYDVLVYGDENGTEELTMQGFYDETKGVFKVSTKDIATDLYIYVIDESRMGKKKTDTDFREELEQRAIVRKVIHLQ